MSGQDILDEIDKNNSAEELNKNTQSIYLNDLVYVVCKVFLFVVLGIIYVLFFKSVENMKNVLVDVKNNVTEKIKNIKLKPPDKPSDKPADNPSDKQTNAQNKQVNANKQPNP